MLPSAALVDAERQPRLPAMVRMSRPMRIAVALSLFLLVAGLAAARVAAQTDVSQHLSLALSQDAGSGRFDMTAEMRFDAPEGDIVLPVADWVTMAALWIDGLPVPVTPGASRIVATTHGGAPVTVMIQGALPETGRMPSAAAAGPEGGLLLGAAWRPVDAAPAPTLALSVETPGDISVAVTAALPASRRIGARRITEATLPPLAPGNLGLFFGPYIVEEAEIDGHTVRSYFHADAVQGAPGLAARYHVAAARYLETYGAAIGPLPYAGFSIVSTEFPVGLGFAGLTYVSRDILGHPYMLGRSLAHEALHSWWGNAVATDPAEGNWAEGLTSFMADYALAEAEGAEAARRMRAGWLRALDTLPPQEMRPLSDFRGAAHPAGQAEGYGKAALVLHMLRDRIGAEAMAEGLRLFYARHNGGAAGWTELLAAMSESAGQSLDWVRRDWIDRAGLPRLELVTAVAEGRSLRLTLAQGTPIYHLDVPLVIRTEAGPVQERMTLDSREATIVFDLPAPPLSVAVDPDLDLPRHLAAGELAPILSGLGAAGHYDVLDALPDPAPALAATLGAALARGAEVRDVGNPDALGRAPALIIAPMGDIAALHERITGAALPEEVAAGMAQDPALLLWAARDGGGALRVFAGISEGFDGRPPPAIFRVSGQSYAVISADGALDAGLFPDPGGALRVTFAPQGAP